MCHRTAQSLALGYRSYSEYNITINRPDTKFLIPSDASKVLVSSTPKVNNLPKSRSVGGSDNILKNEGPKHFHTSRKLKVPRSLYSAFPRATLRGPRGKKTDTVGCAESHGDN